MKFIAIFLVVCACAASARAVEPSDCWSLRKHGHKAEAQSCFESLTRSADAYRRAEGFWGLEQWERANEQFRLATQPANSKALCKVRWGMLLHERFNDSDAADLFREALAAEPSNAEAYVGLATVSAESFSGKASAYAMKAIELDPKLAMPMKFWRISRSPMMIRRPRQPKPTRLLPSKTMRSVRWQSMPRSNSSPIALPMCG